MANTNYDEVLCELLQEAIDGNLLDEEEDRAAIGVARRVIDLGDDSLSPKQRVLYDRVIAPVIKACADERERNELANRHGGD